MKTEDLLLLISHNDFMIFGTGFVAEMFWRALQARDITEHVRGFIKTNAFPGETFHGLPVFNGCFDPGLPICLAVHEAVEREVTASVKSAVRERMIRIYPNLHELLFGKPLAYNQQISFKNLINSQDPNDHWLDIRYLAANAFLSSSMTSRAEDLYIRAMAVHSSPETARKRLLLLKKLVRSMKEDGFQPDRPILTDTKGRIIDGLHRTAAAAALGIKEIPCNIVRASDSYPELLTDKVRLTDAVLQNAGFTVEEMDLIHRAGEQMREKAERN